MTQSNIKWVPLSEFIEPFKKRCGDSDAKVSGVDINKQFIDTRAVMDGIDVSKYYLVPPKHFACNLMHIGRDERLPIAYNSSDGNLVVTSAYYVFKVKDLKRNELLDEFLYIFFNSKEIDRLTWFYTDSSVRGNLKESRFLDILIPVPSIDAQTRIVDTWKHIREVKEQNEAIAEPLFQLCQSYLQELKNNLELNAIGEYLYYSDKRNDSGDYKLEDVKGISIDKVIIKTKANMDNVSLKPYKIFAHNEFCYVPVTSRNGDKITIAINPTNDTYIVSSSYEVFGVRDHQKLLPEYLYMWFCRSEFDRLARFNSWGSARETYKWEDLCRFQIPLPSLEVQKAIVNIFQCAKEAKHIAEEADKLSREICPALIQKVIHD